MSKESVVEALVEALKARGVERMFGIPGGGSSLDVIEAGAAAGIDFVLSRTEAAGAFMACATAEITGAPGVLLTGVGPGMASAVNGMAYAYLDRAPLILVTDAADEAQAYVTHQIIDQPAITAPITKDRRSLKAGDGRREIDALLDTALAEPLGPIHIDLSSAQARKAAGSAPAESGAPTVEGPTVEGWSGSDLAKARALLAEARRPAIVAGVQATRSAYALRGLAEALGCPVFTTYKAKGCMADSHALQVGHYTGGEAEAPCLREADLIVLFGFDPVEAIPQPWRYESPILEIGSAAGLPHYCAPDVSLIGDPTKAAAALHGANRPSDWTAAEIADHRNTMRAALRAPAKAGIPSWRLVESLAKAARPGARATVDAGAHMFSAMGFWPAEEASGTLISDGLSTMSYALPAAIASALAEPDRPAVCMTGDGGLMMVIAELATAAERGLDILVAVFNDSALSLIDIKQAARGMESRGVRYPGPDFARIAEGFGCRAWRVEEPNALDAAIAEALAAKGPRLLDVRIDPSIYQAQIKALRG
ncbi:MAG: thiamine pyrophosphate-binding protein [Rhodospirillaceae bacterium]|jgi:acetolactate synthase I/II/III large subunit|nr:thiamine pyrophosphate-binding protein [Rhodospirillaceae bacterium]